MVWGSMYGMSERAVQSVPAGIANQGVPARVFRVPQSHVSHILAAAWRSTGLAVGSPAYEYRLFPPAAAALEELARKKVVRKTVLPFGSYGWKAGAAASGSTRAQPRQVSPS
jgi:flavorubredoxin